MAKAKLTYPSKYQIEQALIKRDKMLSVDTEMGVTLAQAMFAVLDDSKTDGACLVDSIERLEGVLQFARTWAERFHEASVMSGVEKE